MRRGTGRTVRRGAEKTGGDTAGLAAFAVQMLVMPVVILIFTLIADADDRIGSIRQLILRELVAVERIEVDRLMRECHEHQSQYAQQAYCKTAPKLARVELQPGASHCSAEPI